MNEIKCPHCYTTFKVDESSYADILKLSDIKAIWLQIAEIRHASNKAEQNGTLVTDFNL